MPLSGRDTEPSDYQNLYRKHVHENMLLHERLRSIDGIERNKIKELQNNAFMFKGKYLKYLKKNKGAITSDTKWKKQGKDYKHRSAFFVCKNFAYPAKAWHDLVDVSKSSLDVYKSQVLSSAVGERPDDKTAQTDNMVTHSASVTPRLMRKPKRNPYNKYDKNNNSLPSITINHSNEASPSPILVVDDTERYSGASSARLPNEANFPRIGRSASESERGDRLRLPDGLSSTSLDSMGSDVENECHQPYRRRSQTISTTINHTTVGSEYELPRLNSFHSLSESRWMKLKGKVRLAVTLSGDDSPQVKRLARSFENLKHCRYLRASDDASQTEGLDSMSYSREKLNEIV